MVVLGGLKPLRLSSSGSGKAGAPEEDRADVHARDSPATVLLMPCCLLILLDPATVPPC